MASRVTILPRRWEYEPRAVQCSLCSDLFGSVMKYRRHLRQHHGLDRYSISHYVSEIRRRLGLLSEKERIRPGYGAGNTRRALKMGGGTLYVSMPFEWVRSNGIAPGELLTVEVDRERNALVVRVAPRVETPPVPAPVPAES